MHRPSGAALLCLLSVTIVAPAVAAVQVVQFAVTARVVGRASLETIDAPPTIAISAEDLARGHKTVEAVYRVRTARLERYVLRFAPRVGITESVSVRGLAAPVTVGFEEVTVLKQAVPGGDELRLAFRLDLRPGLPAGTYAWPVVLSVSPP